MAKAEAHCICENCGAEFIKYKRNCFNRREADEWEKWAEENITLCPECYKKKQPLDIECHLGRIQVDGVELLLAITSTNAFDKKEELKDVGFRWKLVEHGRAWYYSLIVQSCGIDVHKQIVQTVDSLSKRLGKIHLLDESVYLIGLQDAVQKWKGIRDQLKNLGEYPHFSEEIKEMISEGRWNGNIYGTPGKYAIYLSGKKVPLTDEQADDIKSTQAEQAEWKESYKALIG